MERKVGLAAVAVMAAAITPARAFAQTTGVVTGTVVDRASQRPVSDVQVLVVGTQRGGITDARGRFSIAGVPTGARQVRVRRVGYSASETPVTVVAGQPATVNLVIEATTTVLQEVTVNAITGQAQSRLSTGTNTGYVNVDSLPKGPITQFSDVLQGRVAGVNLQSAAGQVGASQRVRIRGANSISLSNEPLIYIDGILSTNSKGGFTLGGQDYSRLNDINFETVENVEVLKGPAAAAIYGSAAANGVILITTRRGRSGAPRWRGYAETGPVLDRNPYPLNYAALQRNAGADPAAPTSVLEEGGILNVTRWFGSSAPYTLCPNFQAALPSGTAGACTQDVRLSFDFFRDDRITPLQSGNFTKGGLNISGGSDNLTYFLGADNQAEQGVIRPNSLYRTNLQANLTARIAQNANVTVTANYVRSNTRRISSDNSIFSPLINGFLGPAYYIPGFETDTAGGAPPNRPGSYFGYSFRDQQKVSAGQGLDRYVLGAQGNYTPVSWLRFNGNIGLDQFSRLDQQTIDPSFNLPLAQSYILGFRNASRAANSVQSANASGIATFNLLRNLVSATTLGTSYQRENFTSVDCYGVSLPAGTRSCSSTATQFAVGEAFTDVRLIGGFVQQQFTLNDRLFLSASVRGDNNSTLVRNVSGLSYFPQVNASWVLSKEGFFPQSLPVSLFRLRAGVGQAGLRPGYGAAETFYAPVASQQTNVEQSALVLNNTGNANLKVERTTETEGGFDLNLFGDRITAEYTYFAKRSRDALVARNLAPSAGLNASVFQNLGSITNKGQEVNLGAQIYTSPRFALSSRLILTTLANKLVTLGQGIAPITLNRGAQQLREGFPAGGFFATPYRYNDANGDGKLAVSEISVDTTRFVRGTRLAYFGPSLPTNTQGLSFDATVFKYLRLSTLLERRAGNKQLNYTEFFRCTTLNANPFYSQCGALGNPNASLQSQAAFLGAANLVPGVGASPVGYIEDARFVRWRELTARIEVPTAFAARYLRVRNGAAFSVSGRNLRTWTNYTGLDPEINETGGGSNFTQGEFNTQPPVRTFTFRVDITP